jgi:hypothetical protein
MRLPIENQFPKFYRSLRLGRRKGGTCSSRRKRVASDGRGRHCRNRGFRLKKLPFCPTQFSGKSFLNLAILQPISSFDAGTFAFDAIYDQGVLDAKHHCRQVRLPVGSMTSGKRPGK